MTAAPVMTAMTAAAASVLLFSLRSVAAIGGQLLLIHAAKHNLGTINIIFKINILKFKMI
jgi:hypothetical protein